ALYQVQQGIVRRHHGQKHQEVEQHKVKGRYQLHNQFGPETLKWLYRIDAVDEIGFGQVGGKEAAQDNESQQQQVRVPKHLAHVHVQAAFAGLLQQVREKPCIETRQHDSERQQ